MDTRKPVLGIIGAGRLGTAVARQALKAGYTVKIANSREPTSLGLILDVLLPGAAAATVTEAIRQSELTILAIPLSQYKNLPRDEFVGKIVIDAMNYWPPTEGFIEEFTNEGISSSEYIQHYLPAAKVVKSLNHIAYSEIEGHSLPRGASERRAIALAGNDHEAKLQVSRLIDDFGFDPVDFGQLHEGRRFQPDTRIFNTRCSVKDMLSYATLTK